MSAFSSGVTAFGGVNRLRRANPMGSFDPTLSPGGPGRTPTLADAGAVASPAGPGAGRGVKKMAKVGPAHPGLRRGVAGAVVGGLPQGTQQSSAGTPINNQVPAWASQRGQGVAMGMPQAYNNGPAAMPMRGAGTGGEAWFLSQNRARMGPDGQMMGSTALDAFARGQRRPPTQGPSVYV